MVITPFTPNKNGQAIPKSEAENIIRTALNQPLKINFDGKQIGGHAGSVPIGPITNLAYSEDEITGQAIIWNEEFPQTAEYLKSNIEDDIGTSWELYFTESVKDDNAIEWLHGIKFMANTIVSNPAYGSKTLIKAIAEDLSQKEKVMADELTMEEIRSKLDETSNTLYAMWNMLDELYYKTYEIEEAELAQNATKNVDTFGTMLQTLITTVNDRASKVGVEAIAELQSKLDTALAEITQFKTAAEQTEKDTLLISRKQKLAEAGLIVDNTRDTFLLGLSEELFTQYVADLSTVKQAKAEIKNEPIKIPEPIGTANYSTEDIVNSHKALVKKDKI